MGLRPCSDNCFGAAVGEVKGTPGAVLAHPPDYVVLVALVALVASAGVWQLPGEVYVFPAMSSHYRRDTIRSDRRQKRCCRDDPGSF